MSLALRLRKRTGLSFFILSNSWVLSLDTHTTEELKIAKGEWSQKPSFLKEGTGPNLRKGSQGFPQYSQSTSMVLIWIIWTVTTHLLLHVGFIKKIVFITLEFERHTSPVSVKAMEDVWPQAIECTFLLPINICLLSYYITYLILLTPNKTK